MWFVLALIAVVFWGVEDVYMRLGTDPRDKYSQYRISVWTGICFTVLALLVTPWSESGLGVIKVLINNPYFLLIPALYALTLILSHVGFRYLEAGIMAPLKNASGAFSTTMFLGWYAYLGTIDRVWEQITKWDIVGTVLIVGGIIVLGYVEQFLQYNKGYLTNKLGVLAFVFPLIFCFTDTLDTVVCGIMLSDESGANIGPVDYFRLYALCFAVIGVISWLIIRYRTGVPFNPFQKQYFNICRGSFLEAAAMLSYTIAMDFEPMYVAIIVAPYCLFTEIYSYILGVRFKKGQYACFAAIIIGIILMACGELAK